MYVHQSFSSPSTVLLKFKIGEQLNTKLARTNTDSIVAHARAAKQQKQYKNNIRIT